MTVSAGHPSFASESPVADLLRRPRRAGDRLFLGALSASALLPPVLMILFFAVLVYGARLSIHAFGLSFLTSSIWEPHADREQYGALPFILGTLISSAIALLIAAPAGIAVATFIGEVLPARLRPVPRFLIEALATIPSVVYGLWGIFVMAPWVMRWLAPSLSATAGFLPIFGEPKDPRNMLCAALILSVMVLPTIVAVSLDAMRMVPSTYRDAALALGATRWEVIRMGVWPAIRSGFFGACTLALGRALGETMAVTMIIGNGHRFSRSLFAASDTIASTIANQFAESPSDLFTAALIELALILFMVTLLVNVAARFVLSRLVSTAAKGD